MKAFAALILGVLALTWMQPPHAASSARPELGASAAFDARGRLWVVYAEPTDGGSHVRLERSDDRGRSWSMRIAATPTPEPVSADGENRPKIAFGAAGEIYVAWTSPGSERFTGNIRFTRSLDDGRTWSKPVVVHRDRQLITHRFESLAVDGAGRIWAAWIDKRDLERAKRAGQAYSGAAVYYAYSQDRGATWRGDFKLADHSCECCRIALARDGHGRIAALWRHVFAPNERDHAYALLDPHGRPTITRATFDRWRIDACPHHGPSLAFGADDERHAVWFNQVEGDGRVFYGRLTDGAPAGLAELPAGASHADVAAHERYVAVAWKRFDGEATRIETWLSHDGGRSFTSGPDERTTGDSDQPRLLQAPHGEIVLVWRVADRIIVRSLFSAPQSRRSHDAREKPAAASMQAGPSSVRPFARSTLAEIESRLRGQPFWLVLWDLECSYCMHSLRGLAQAQARNPRLRAVTISTDSIGQASQITARLASLGVRSEAYAFAQDSVEALRHAIDPGWAGEKPRAYRYGPDGRRKAVSGVIDASEYGAEF